MTLSDVMLSPRFRQGANGHLFINVVQPGGEGARDVVLMLPPLFEELNKSRRMYALQARALASRGYVAVLPDPHGVGDSEGSLSTASMDMWREDLACVAKWLVDTYSPKEVHIFAMRSAALFCGLLDVAILPVRSWVLWSPIDRGSKLVRDLFRQALIVARNQGNATVTSKSLREKLSEDGSFEISGYSLPADLVADLENACLPDELSTDVDAFWFDVRPGIGPDAPVRDPQRVMRWRQAGVDVDYRVFDGPPFWHTAEISTVPDLIEATTTALVETSRA